MARPAKKPGASSWFRRPASRGRTPGRRAVRSGSEAAALWLVGAADPDLASSTTSRATVSPQLAGEGRPGSNLYLCAVVALDMKTGKLRWHYQVIRHDIWEADIAISPVLYDAQVDGRPRKAIAAMRADGYLFMLDRETGKPLTRIEDRPVTQDSLQRTAATQPFPAGADSALPPCDAWKKESLPRGFDLDATTTRPRR